MPPGSNLSVWGRFDDLVAGTAQAFESPSRLLTALTPHDVVPVLAEVDRATQDGCWAFGYVAYEAAAGLDPRWAGLPLPPGLPLVQFGLCAEPTDVPPIVPPPGRARGYALSAWRRDWTEPDYGADVARVREHIAAGDTYQLNLTVRMHAEVSGDLAQLYADLAWAQRGRHAAFLDLGRHVVASASPELFVEWTDDLLRTRPMKGTAPRGRTGAEDVVVRERLLGSEKERAENLMIVDLLRNDLGRIAEVGSVDVPALFTAERYETVWQLTSDVTARPRPGTSLVDVFRALFPSGSVTGAPKDRSIELIRTLETRPRGVYCGAVGVVAPPGQAFRARFNVAIRTVTVDGPPGSPSSAPAAGSPGAPTPRPSTPSCWPRRRSSPSRTRSSTCSRRWRTCQGLGCAIATGIWTGSPTPPRTSASPSTGRRSRPRSPTPSGAPARPGSGSRCIGTRRSTSFSPRCRLPGRSRAPGRRLRAGGRRAGLAAAQDHPARRLHRSRRAPPRGRRRRPGRPAACPASSAAGWSRPESSASAT